MEHVLGRVQRHQTSESDNDQSVLIVWLWRVGAGVYTTRTGGRSVTTCEVC